MYPPNLNVPLPDPSPLAPEQTAKPDRMQQALSLITPLFALGTALGGSPMAGASFLHGAHQTLQRQDQEKQVKAHQDAQLAQQQAQLAATEQYRAQQQEMQRQQAIHKVITDTAVQARAAKDRDEYESIITANEALAGQFYGLRPNTIRAAVPYHAPNANTKMAEAGAAFLKNPANAQAIEDGKIDGYIMVDVQDDGKPLRVPLKDVLSVTPGVQLDPQTGAPIFLPKEKKAAGGVQLDDEAFLGAVEKFEAEKGRKATQAERGEIALTVKKNMGDAGRVAGGSDTGLKDYQKFNAGEKLATKWTQVSQPVREMNRQFNLMQTGLQRFKQGDKMGGSQAVLVTFQKILDPTSVVRESEYARSASGLSLISRLEGYADKLKSGGAGVPVADLAAMVETARQFLSSMQSYTDGQRKRILSTSKQYGIDPSLVVDDLTSPDANATAQSGPAAGSVVELRGVGKVRVDKVNPDGTFDYTKVR